MLIPGNTVLKYMNEYGIKVNGVLHIGAHECEERPFYNTILNVSDSNIIWVDGNKEKVEEMKKKGYDNIYDAVLDENEKDIIFNITDNSQASSVLQLNHQAGFYKNINIIKKVPCKTETLTQFFNRIKKSPSEYNFWNLDIQGTEFYVLRGSKDLLETCEAIYTEVNSEEVYTGCGLINDIDKLLGEYNFKRVHTLWTDVKWGDALYLKVKSI